MAWNICFKPCLILMNKRVAAIDTGTNTCLMLIAENDNNSLKVIDDVLRVPRLGRNVDKEKNISPASVSKLIEVLKEYKIIIDKNSCATIKATGTSALRDARNRDEVVKEVFISTGVKIEIISGEKEAMLSYNGAVSGVTDKESNYIVIDIGGGSTEICYLENGELIRKSLDIGSVRITEKFFTSDNHSQLTSAQEFIRREFAELSEMNFENKKLIGTAGTVTTLSLIKNGYKDFTPEIENKIISSEEINDILNRLSKMKNDEILSLGSFMKDRNDIIFAGVLILNEFLNFTKLDSVTVSIRGLRYGIALEELEING